jgi:hypothetical protein
VNPLVDRRTLKGRTLASSRVEVPPVSVFEMGIAFTLFRRAALDEVIEDVFHPFTDQFAVASLSEDGRHRGMMILAIHYDRPDTPTSIMKRIESFVQLLRCMAASPSEAWTQFCAHHDRFVPVVHAIAWCPVRSGHSFEMAEFISMARNAPLTILQGTGAHRVN